MIFLRTSSCRASSTALEIHVRTSASIFPRFIIKSTPHPDPNPKPPVHKILKAAFYRFEGAITVSHFHAPSRKRAFYFDVTFILDHPHLLKLASAEKPPLHFHPYQEEYIEVTEGRLGVEVEGKEYILTPTDGEFTIHPWSNHRLYPLLPAPGSEDLQTTRFLLSGEGTNDAFKLDAVFFQNWYRYQDAIVVGGEKMELLQVMNVRFNPFPCTSDSHDILTCL